MDKQEDSKLKRILETLLHIVTIFLLIVTFNISKKTDFNLIEAEKLLKETYGPINTLVRESRLNEDKDLLLVPDYIKTREDTYSLLKGKMEDHEIESYMEDFIIEKEEGIFLDPEFYIPTIYAEDAKVNKAYIKKSENFLKKILGRDPETKEELIIKEKWSKDGTRRTNYFIKDEDNKWILEGISGSLSHGFADIKDNPWSEYWQENE